jgi:predicted small lipoprotein YifL
MNAKRLLLVLLVLSLTAPMLGACGRKGELHPPPDVQDSDFPRSYPR